MKTRKKIIIETLGKSEEDHWLALEEATKKIKKGYKHGKDQNEDGAYFFSVLEKEG